MKYKILFIDRSELILNFMVSRFNGPYFDVIVAKDGLDGLIKMRNQLPDLIVMDFYLPKLDGLSFLNEKNALKGTRDIPVIILSSKIDRETIVKLGKFKISKILSKPIQIDLLTQAISTIFNIKLDVDKRECLIDVHLNDDILFIEVSGGLNFDKIEIMKYKILEIKRLYELEVLQKVLLIMVDIPEDVDLDDMLNKLLNNIVETTGAAVENINVLTKINHIVDFFMSGSKLTKVKIVEDFATAIENLGKIDLFYSNESDLDDVKKSLISPKKSGFADTEIDIKFSDEKIKEDNYKDGKRYNVAIVDDDLAILELMEDLLTSSEINISTYENGKLFVEDYAKVKFDIIFLDILMPIMNGFEVLDYLKANNNSIPVIILTALSDRDSILKARQYGIKSYLTKPANINFIKHKIQELLVSNF